MAYSHSVTIDLASADESRTLSFKHYEAVNEAKNCAADRCFVAYDKVGHFDPDAFVDFKKELQNGYALECPRSSWSSLGQLYGSEKFRFCQDSSGARMLAREFYKWNTKCDANLPPFTHYTDDDYKESRDGNPGPRLGRGRAVEPSSRLGSTALGVSARLGTRLGGFLPSLKESCTSVEILNVTFGSPPEKPSANVVERVLDSVDRGRLTIDLFGYVIYVQDEVESKPRPWSMAASWIAPNERKNFEVFIDCGEQPQPNLTIVTLCPLNEGETNNTTATCLGSWRTL